MKNTTLALVIVIVLVLIGGWLYYSHTYAPAPAPASDTTSTSTEPVTNPRANGTSAPLETTNPNAGKGTTATTAQATSSVPGANVTLGVTGSGTTQHIVAYNGHALYTYDPDRSASPASACTGSCALAWPPYLVTTKTGLVAEYPLQGTIGTITRLDGKLQVTYDGLPLYFYAGDFSASDARGDGISGVWHLAKP